MNYLNQALRLEAAAVQAYHQNGNSFLYTETSLKIFRPGSSVGFERTDNIKISTITFVTVDSETLVVISDQ